MTGETKKEEGTPLGFLDITKLTKHQIDLLFGRANPDNDEEYDWLENHCNDVLEDPSKPLKPKKTPRREFIPPTHAAITHEKMGLDD